MNKRLWRSMLSMALAACMMFSLCGNALAAGVKPELNYVSIGDSMANGYCFDGYEQGNGSAIDFLNGIGVYGEDAYPEQFEEYLEEQGYEVDHTKLAVSALRAEDLNFLLGGREEPQDGWEDQVNGYTEVYDDEVLSAFYQEAVAEADVITLGVGNASFGAYMLHRVTDALGVFGASLDEDEIVDLEEALSILDFEQKEVILEAYEDLKAEMAAYIPAELAAQYNVDQVCDILAYTAAGYLVNYKGALEQIIKLNPDVDIVLVGLMNTTYGMEVTGEGFDPIPVGDIMDIFFDALNTYAAGLPAVMQAAGEWEEADFLYAEQPAPKFISQQFAALKDAEWTEVDRLSGEIVRDRNITAYNDNLRYVIGMALNGGELGENPLEYITLSDVEAFEAAEPVEWSSGNPDKNMSIAIYLAIEDAVAESCDTLEIPLSGLEKIAGDLSGVFSGLMAMEGMTESPSSIRTTLGGYLTSTDELQGMCKIYALFKVGNGMSVHPTPAGHDEIAEAVIAAYDAGVTVQDHLNEKVLEALEVLKDLAVEAYNTPEVQAEIARLQSEIDRINGELQIAAGEAAIELQKELDKAKTDLNNYLMEVAQQVQAELPGMLQDAYDNLVNAVMDAVEEYAPKAADAVYNYLYNNPAEVIAFVAEYGDDALAFVEEYAEEILMVLGFLAKTFGDEVVEYVMANPEEVLNTMVEWVDEHGENAWALIMVYCQELGLCDKIADMDDQLRNALDDLYDQVEAIIAGKLEEIDLEGMMGALEALEDAINNEIVKVTAEIEKVKTAIEALEGQLEALKDELKAKYEELENASEELKAEIEQAIADIEAAIETVEQAIEELENIIEEAKAVIEELQHAAAEIGKAIDAVADAIEKGVEDINAAIDAVQDAMEDLAEIIPVVEELIEQLNDFVDEVQDIAENVANAAEELIDEIGEVMTAIGDEANKIYLETVAAIEKMNAFVEGVIAEVEAAIIEMNAKVEQAIADFKAAYEAAVTGDYHVTADSYYVAIADVKAQGYEALLAEELGVENAVLNAQLAEEMLMNLAMNPAWQAEIAKADLVSVSLNNTYVIDQVTAVLAGAKPAEINWSLYAGEEGAAYIEAAIEELKAYLVENMGENPMLDVPGLLTVLVESYVYDCVSAAFNYHEVVGAIHKINPEAEVVLVGMVNPLDGAVVEVEGTEVPLGDIYTAIVELSNLHQTVVAMLGENTTFVNVAEAETGLDAIEVINMDNMITVLSQMAFYGAQMPTAEGHEYIKEAILNAETVTTCEECAGEAVVENEVPATCTEPGSYDEVVYCTVCGVELSRVTVPVEVLEHTEGEAVVENEVPAKCEVPGGYDEVVYCTECGEELSRVHHEIPALEHEDAADDGDHICDNEGCDEVVGEHVDADNNGTCDDCGTVINPGQGDDNEEDEEDDNDRPSRPSISDDEEEECDGGKNCPSKKFVDVDQNQWYHEAVDFSIVEGLMNGTSETTYEPLSTTTRAMIVTMLYRLEGEPEVDHEIGFEDVAADTWYTEAVRWAEAEGIVNGYSATEFGPNDYVTREQMVTILHRYAEYKGVATDKRDDLKAFPDADAVSAWALDAMQWAVEAELIEGMNGVLNPTGDANRAQIATVFMRMIQNILG
ncbi:MAG: S-layer homology domain-containing protein [Clostridia bacterium]|nr:S-layer homology domain-containing protein [Clostridia bacterium]